MLLHTPSHRQAVLALLLLVPAASIGIAARLYIPGTVGQVLFVLTRIWILALPLIWLFWVEQGNPVFSLPSRREFLAGTVLGLLMFAIVVLAYWFIGQSWLNPVDVRIQAQQVGLTIPSVYLVSAFYFTFLNSFIEEYIWRWFVYRQCEVLLPTIIAVGLAALCFTLHHTIALVAYTGNWLVVVLGSLGVFMAGALWSWCYLSYRSLWPGYISHLLADLAIALVGWHLLFG